jgi:hypothetical protein
MASSGASAASSPSAEIGRFATTQSKRPRSGAVQSPRRK